MCHALQTRVMFAKVAALDTLFVAHIAHAGLSHFIRLLDLVLHEGRCVTFAKGPSERESGRLQRCSRAPEAVKAATLRNACGASTMEGSSELNIFTRRYQVDLLREL